jgi:hypothetical protein
MWRPSEHSTFRANPAYTLVLLDRLSEHDRELLQKADGADDLYGALVPQDSALNEWRSVSCDTALLFMTLTEPGPLPGYMLRRLGDDVETNVKRLLLDGVLQISLGTEFVGGPQAAELLACHAPRVERGRNFDPGPEGPLRGGAGPASVLFRPPARIAPASRTFCGQCSRRDFPGHRRQLRCRSIAR